MAKKEFVVFWHVAFVALLMFQIDKAHAKIHRQPAIEERSVRASMEQYEKPHTEEKAWRLFSINVECSSRHQQHACLSTDIQTE